MSLGNPRPISNPSIVSFGTGSGRRNGVDSKTNPSVCTPSFLFGTQSLAERSILKLGSTHIFSAPRSNAGGTGAACVGDAPSMVRLQAQALAVLFTCATTSPQPTPAQEQEQQGAGRPKGMLPIEQEAAVVQSAKMHIEKYRLTT
jgi:hypothetical protein